VMMEDKEARMTRGQIPSNGSSTGKILTGKGRPWGALILGTSIVTFLKCCLGTDTVSRLVLKVSWYLDQVLSSPPSYPSRFPSIFPGCLFSSESQACLSVITSKGIR
jgi:hypothetical protein